MKIAEHGKAAHLARLAIGQTSPQGGSGGAALGGPKKPMPACNALDMPTSVWSEIARKYVEPIPTGKANDNRRSSVDAPGVLVSRDTHESWPPMSIAKWSAGMRGVLLSYGAAGQSYQD